MIVVAWGSWIIRNFLFDTWIRGVLDALLVDDHIDFSMIFYFIVGIH
jgi:hypothetical protein